MGGLGAAVALLGPALRPGSLLSLDLVITPTIPVPDGIWGLGPSLPRRVPLGVPLAWLSSVVGGPVAGKALLAGCIAGAFAGACRLAAGAHPVARVAAGALYALGPFAATRLGAGQWGILAGMAVLPWALPTLARPSREPARTFLWLAALGATGVWGGFMGSAVLAVGLIHERDRRPARVLLLALVAQLPWLVPGVLVRGGGLRLAGAEPFATEAEGPLGVVGGLLAQHGFWRGASQVGGRAGPGVVLVGVGLLLLALYGAKDLPRRWGRAASTAAAGGLVVAASSSVPLVRSVHAWLAELPVGSPLRESQRALPLFLVWLAPAAAHGATRLARERPPLRLAAPALALVAAGALALPGLWGVGGRLEPVEFPPGWGGARAVVARNPGTVLALPWREYLDITFAGGRRVLNPLPDYLGGDVLTSSDPELGPPLQESTDPRERTAAALAARARDREPVGEELAGLGIRWVVLLHEVDWRAYAALDDDPALRAVMRDPALTLYEVRAWPGSVVAVPGRVLTHDSLAAPLHRIEGHHPATWARPGTRGWLRGLSPARVTEVGLLALPSGGGWVWYWPALVALAGHATTVGVTVWAVRRLRRGARSHRESPHDTPAGSASSTRA